MGKANVGYSEVCSRQSVILFKKEVEMWHGVEETKWKFGFLITYDLFMNDICSRICLLYVFLCM